jgi:hypothetical protein
MLCQVSDVADAAMYAVRCEGACPVDVDMEMVSNAFRSADGKAVKMSQLSQGAKL